MVLTFQLAIQRVGVFVSFLLYLYLVQGLTIQKKKVTKLIHFYEKVKTNTQGICNIYIV